MHLSLSCKISEKMPPISKGYGDLPRNSQVPRRQPAGQQKETQRSVESMGQGNLLLLLSASSMNISCVPLQKLLGKRRRKEGRVQGKKQSNTDIHNPTKHFPTMTPCHEPFEFPYVDPTFFLLHACFPHSFPFSFHSCTSVKWCLLIGVLNLHGCSGGRQRFEVSPGFPWQGCTSK